VANSASGTDTTDANGEATFCYTGTNVGEDTITAFADTNSDGDQDAGEPLGAATKTWTPAAPATLMLSPATDTNTAGDEHCVTATVDDAFGNPTPGISVEFEVSGANPTAGAQTTDANGQATFCYTGTVAGEDVITAFADTNGNGELDPLEPTGAATKTWTPGAPATLTLAPPADTNTVGEQHCVTATVEDAFGNPTPGIIVRFAVSGSVTTAGSCTTNGTGACSFTYSGPTSPGADAITAYADTDADMTQDAGEPAGAAEKTWVPAAPATLVLSPAAATNPVGTSHTVTATVRDAFGNPTPNITVRFTVIGSVTTSGQCTTNGTGMCSFTYSGPTLPGGDAISAYADTNNSNTQAAGEPPGAATKTWTPLTRGCPENGGDDDEDDDGLEDKDESLLGTLLGIADSDGDGVRDGNDDSDDDGEDDEDEDDGTDDECPNDSDGDGEDDEDEDD
jgi:uncharacterized protein (DUF2141 family)